MGRLDGDALFRKSILGFAERAKRLGPAARRIPRGGGSELRDQPRCIQAAPRALRDEPNMGNALGDPAVDGNRFSAAELSRVRAVRQEAQTPTISWRDPRARFGAACR